MTSIDTVKDNVCINKIVAKRNDIILKEGDLIVPDIKPDILNTISTSANACIYKKEVMDGKIRVDGSILCYIIYLADDIESNVRALNTSLDFSEIINIEECRQGMNLDEEVEVKSIDCKVLNGRKISIRATLEFKTRIYSNEEIEIIKEIKSEKNIQIQNKIVQINSKIGTGSTKVYAKETIPIDNIDNLAEVLKTNLSITGKDIKISYNKILAKADSELKIMYLTEDGRINTVSGAIPIMGFIDIQNISEENICDVRYQLSNLVIKPNQTEEHSIYVEVEVEITADVFESKEINAIEDIYMPQGEITFETRTIKMITQKKNTRETLNIRQNINIEELNGNKIIDVSVKPRITNETPMTDIITYEGEINLEFIFEAENGAGISTKTITIPYNFTVNIDGINQNSNIQTNIEIKTQDFVVQNNSSIDTKIDIEFNVNSFSGAKLSLIDNIQETEARNENKYSIIVYFVKPGDTLWKIAKRFGTTIESIAQINDIENVDKLNVGQRIFIPKYVECKKKVYG